MCHAASIWAWKQKLPGEPFTKMVLLALADHANDQDFECWPSVSHLARKTSICERSIIKHLHRLRESGLIQITERQGKSNIFKLNIDPKIFDLLANSTPAADAPPKTPPLQQMHPTPAADADPPLQQMHPNQSINQSGTIIVGNGVSDPCPHQKIIELYHKHLPMGTAVMSWSDTRASYLKTRWREDPKRQRLEWWDKFFTYCAKSEFLTGKVNGGKSRPFLINLEWILKPSNFAKIIEGYYHDA